ncbi:Isy1-like splicing family protein [Onchocerca flexuosa]|uniref:Isy1-like splicing family protein n=1 Tax=Onchocerca flexuosa TaxID=387005 RepID=A0A238C3S3_9BILA|nr:Isy1-like splicing family protein [Onchocerca flexuosa]
MFWEDIPLINTFQIVPGLPCSYSIMARNAEKAMTALARWRRMKEEEEKGPVAKRPNDVNECNTLNDAERYRKQVTMEIAKKIALIQNPGLGEFKIRDLNDEINKLLRVKYAWETRIKELGGQDYRKIAPKELDREGREVAGSKGYKYFGAAKDLPGVRELFEKVGIDESRKNRMELIKFLDADYYGYMDDDDGLLVPLEMDAEIKARLQIEKDWDENKDALKAKKAFEEIDIYKIVDDSDEEDINTKQSILIGDDGKKTFIQHVVVPSQKEIENLILERKKAQLFDRYVGSSSNSY